MILRMPGLPRRIILSITGMALLSGLAFSGVALWMANGVNAVELSRSIEAMEHHLSVEEARAANFTLDYGFWDEAYEWVSQGDDDWVYSNMGITAEQAQLFQRLWITSPDGSLLYAYGADDAAASFDAAVANTFRTQLFAMPVPDDDAVYNTATGYALIDGRLAVVATGRIRPSSLAGMDPAVLPILTIAVFLQQADGTLLFDETQFPKLNFTQIDSPLDASQTASISLMSGNGNAVGTLGWVPMRPGYMMYQRAIPVIGGLIVLLAGLGVILARAAAHQTTALLKEHIRARSDQLTGLMNRTALAELVTSQAFLLDLQAARIAVIYIDLNRFKQLNDTKGHQIGDEALRIVAQRLLGSVRAHDHVVRKGGDEFLIILASDNPHETVEQISRRLFEPLSLRCEDDTPIELTFAVGGAVSDGHSTWQELLDQADSAMYRAKHTDTRWIELHTPAALSSAI